MLSSCPQKNLGEIRRYSSFKSDEEFERIKKLNVEIFIENLFRDVGGDFNKPTKESLLKVLIELKNYALNFRKKEIVDKHFNEIKGLIDMLKN